MAVVYNKTECAYLISELKPYAWTRQTDIEILLFGLSLLHGEETTDSSHYKGYAVEVHQKEQPLVQVFRQKLALNKSLKEIKVHEEEGEYMAFVWYNSSSPTQTDDMSTRVKEVLEQAFMAGFTKNDLKRVLDETEEEFINVLSA